MCLARQDFEREWPGIGDWKTLQGTATKETGSWLVRFIDDHPGVRGGGGELTLDAATGKVTRRLGYK